MLCDNRARMADSCSPCLDDPMEGLWFYHNILSSLPKLEGLSINSMPKRIGNSPTAASASDQPTHISATRSEDGRQSKSAEHKHNERRKHKHNEKRPKTLSIVIAKPVFELDSTALPPREFRSCPSLPVTDASPGRPSGRGKRRRSVKMRSMSELEYYEVKGFMDLGFVFESENLSPDILGIIPGLQRLGNKASGGSEEEEQQLQVEVGEEHARRPYLSEAWLINRPDSPLLNLRTLPKSPDEADMKKHLRCWAKTVASSLAH